MVSRHAVALVIRVKFFEPRVAILGSAWEFFEKPWPQKERALLDRAVV